jgi:hypothetical protein
MCELSVLPKTCPKVRTRATTRRRISLFRADNRGYHIEALQSREAGDYIAGPAARFELPRHDGRSGRNANHSRRQRGRRRLRRRSGAVWPLGVDAWKQHACAVAARKLTHEEWSRFITGRDYRSTCASGGI